MAATDEKKAAQTARWRRWAVPCALAFVAVIYGSWAVIAKVALHQAGVSALVLAFYRVLGGCTLMVMMHALVEAPHTPMRLASLQRRDVFRFLGLGLLLGFNIGGNILALKSLSPITVAIFQPMLPVVAGIAASVLGVEELSLIKIIGMAMAICGAVVVVIFSKSHHNGHGISLVEHADYARGTPCLVLNVVCGALYNVFQKGVLRSFPPIATAASAFAAASVVIFIGAVSSVGFDSWAWRLGDSWKAVLALLYAIFLATALNYSFLAWANKLSTPTTVTSFQTLQPICAAVLAWFLLGEVLTWGQAGGGLAIICGLGCFLLSRPIQDVSEEEAVLLAGSITAKKADLDI